MLADLKLIGLPEERFQTLASGLHNLGETLAAGLRSAQAENQDLRNDLNASSYRGSRPR